MPTDAARTPLEVRPRNWGHSGLACAREIIDGYKMQEETPTHTHISSHTKLPTITSTIMSLPTGSTTVSVKIIKAYDSLASPAGHTMWSPPAGGEVASQMFDGSGFSFLVEHPSGRRLIFDLGYRHILESTPPAIRTLMEAGIVVGDTKKDVTQQLVEGGIPLESIEAFVWR
jgi:hypothetical protein